MYTFDADCPAHLALGADGTQVNLSALTDNVFIWHQMLDMSESFVSAFLKCNTCKYGKGNGYSAR